MKAKLVSYDKDGKVDLSFPLDGNGTLIGRDADCFIQLPALAVSKHHADIRFKHNHWMLHDMKSTNGTRVNGMRVSTAMLNDDDCISIAGVELFFKLADEDVWTPSHVVDMSENASDRTVARPQED